MPRTTIATLVFYWAVVMGGGACLADGRVALVVGNGAYVNTAPLANTLNDARDMAVALKAVGFEVVEVLDADRSKLDAGLRQFAEKLVSADVALFFYAGHGLQVGAQNYLVPVEAKLGSERDLEFEAVKLDFVLRQMEIEREGKTSLVILDACRDNPLSRNLARSMGTRSAAIGRGLAAASTGLGTFIAYSTQPGNVALDGNGRNSPFTTALLKHIGVKGRSLSATMIEVRKSVVASTDGRQVPWDHSALTGDFYFVPGEASPATGDGADIAALDARLQTLEAEIKKREEATAALAGKESTTTIEGGRPAVPPVTPRPVVAKVSPNFDLSEDVGLKGDIIRAFRAPNPTACRDACEKEAACLGFQHGRKIPVMGRCELFARVDERHEDRQWRSGMRKTEGAAGEAASQGATTPEIKAPIARSKLGFDFYDGIALEGDIIKESAADSGDGCLTVCRNTPGCGAALFDSFLSQQEPRKACKVFSAVSGSVPKSDATAIMRADR